MDRIVAIDSRPIPAAAARIALKGAMLYDHAVARALRLHPPRNFLGASPMLRILVSLVGLVVGYSAFALAGYGAIAMFSSNGFDRSVEASMTAAFVIGPVGALAGFVLGLVFGGGRRKPPP
jgi:predicted lysophospholipase L1 biosynthesis ABC-type transport system permease subunit